MMDDLEQAKAIVAVLERARKAEARVKEMEDGEQELVQMVADACATADALRGALKLLYNGCVSLDEEQAILPMQMQEARQALAGTHDTDEEKEAAAIESWRAIL